MALNVLKVTLFVGLANGLGESVRRLANVAARLGTLTSGTKTCEDAAFAASVWWWARGGVCVRLDWRCGVL